MKLDTLIEGHEKNCKNHTPVNSIYRVSSLFSSPEPRASRAYRMGSLRRLPVIRRPSTLSDDFFSESTGPNVTNVGLGEQK